MLKFTDEHEWLLVDGDTVKVGITDYAQNALGDIVFVEMPEKGTVLSKGDAFGAIESVKAASDMYAPVTGEVVEINDQLEDSPDRINDDPYGDGWMYKVSLEDPDEVGELLDAQAYGEAIADEE